MRSLRKIKKSMKAGEIGEARRSRKRAIYMECHVGRKVGIPETSQADTRQHLLLLRLTYRRSIMSTQMRAYPAQDDCNW